jgi:hypothetical protein
MLTARKENNQSKSTPFAQLPPKAGSFDKVVDSIDGLRDRVQGFTLEQVSEADQRLQTMALGLRELQRRLGMLCEMKDRISRLQEPILQAEADMSDMLEESRLAIDAAPIPAAAVAQVESLLKFRQVIKLLKAAQNVSITLSPRDQEIQAPVIFEPFEIVTTPPKTSVIREPLTEPPLTESPRNEEAAVALTEAQDKSEEIYTSPRLEKQLEEAQFFSNQAADSTQPAEAVGSILIEDLHLESIDATEYPQLNRTFPAEEIPATSNQTQTEASEEEADFDRHLLDDLIRNYGEFSIMPGSPTTGATVHQESKNETPISKSRTDSSTAVVPSSQPTFSLQRKDGELDRKLKKLIKDYGEYDLYSRQTPLKLKTGVIAAFLVLSLVFSGFYFFSSPKSPITPSVSSASQSSQRDSAVPSKETTTVIETNNKEPVSASSVPNGESSKGVDPGSPHYPPNKVATKKTK